MTEGRALDLRSRLLPIVTLGPLLVAAAVLSQMQDFHSNPSIHAMVQIAAGCMALVCGVQVLKSKADEGQNALMVMAMGVLGAAILDLCHGVVSIPTFRPETLQEVVPWGWLPSRVFLSVMISLSLAIGWYERSRGVTGPNLLLAICTLAGLAVAASCLFFLMLPVPLPPAYFPGSPIPRPVELLPGLLFAIALVGCLLQGEWRRSNFQYNLMLALAASVGSHAFFMSFAEKNFDSHFVAAVFCKIISYGFILVGLTLQTREGLRRETAGERLRHRTIVELASDGILTLDSKGAIESFNPAVANLFGYSGGELKGRDIGSLITEPDPGAHDDLLAYFRSVASSPDKGQYIEAAGLRKDGSRFPVEIAGNGIELEGNSLYTAIVRDVTERRQKQAELEDMSERLSLAMVSAGLGCWEGNVDESAFIWDEQMFALYGRDPAAGPPGAWEDWLLMLHPEDRAACRETMLEAAENTAEFQMEYRVIWPDETMHWLKVQGRVVASDAERPPRLIGISRDISANKQYVKELETARAEAVDANRAKSSFLATMSHEIRTPLNGVLGMTELLQHTGLQEHQAEKAELIHKSALSLMGIIEDVLDFSKIEAGKLEIDPSEIDVAGLVKDNCTLLSSLAEKDGVSLETLIDPQIPRTVRGDSTRLRQIITNLVNNAIKFSTGQKRSGQVTVRADVVERQGEQVTMEFCVLDNGVGMDAETLARLFHPFTQADVSTSRRFGGTGLGLAISQRLAELMGGKISVQSQPGEGAIFTLRLPFRQVRSEAEPASEPGLAVPEDNVVTVPSREEAIRQDKLILVAEDNATNREVLLQQLAALGHQADFAENGVEALSQWRQGEYALLLCDLQMPEMDGYELARTVRTEEGGSGRIPIVAFTANTLADEFERCEAAGMDGYLSKPASLEDIRELLERWLPEPDRLDPPITRLG